MLLRDAFIQTLAPCKLPDTISYYNKPAFIDKGENKPHAAMRMFYVAYMDMRCVRLINDGRDNMVQVQRVRAAYNHFLHTLDITPGDLDTYRKVFQAFANSEGFNAIYNITSVYADKISLHIDDDSALISIIPSMIADFEQTYCRMTIAT